MCRHLQVAHRRVTTAVTLVRTLTSIAGSTSWMGQLLGDGVLSRSPLTPRGPSARRLELGPPLLLARLVLAAGQGPARPALGRGPWRALGTRVTGLGRTLRGSAWGHRYALAARTGDGPMDAVTGKGGLVHSGPPHGQRMARDGPSYPRLARPMAPPVGWPCPPRRGRAAARREGALTPRPTPPRPPAPARAQGGRPPPG